MRSIIKEVIPNVNSKLGFLDREKSSIARFLSATVLIITQIIIKFKLHKAGAFLFSALF